MPEPFLRELLEARVASQRDQNFLIFNDLRFTYGEVDYYTNKVANALRELGLKPGDRLAIFLSNSQDFLFCWFATIKLNLTLVPINTALKGEALHYIVQHAAPHALITTAGLLPELDALPPDCRLIVLGDSQEVVINRRGKGCPYGFNTPNQLPNSGFSYEKLLAEASAERPPDVRIREDDTALIMYTSGTTGQPKGVMLNRRAQTNHPLYYHPELLLTAPHETAYVYLPLYHVTGLGVTMGQFVAGGRVALDTEFNVFGFWERIRKYNAVVFPYLGAVIGMLSARPPHEKDADNPARLALGAAAPAALWSAFERRFNLKLYETWGQTETYAVWTLNRSDQTKLGSAGKVPERAEMKIVDETGATLPPGKIGQIAVKATQPGLMFSGYYQNEALNQQVFQDGWYFTGDAGELDSTGYLWFRGRLKDYIRRRGENISALQIESVVNQHQAVLESAAVGVPSILTEEEVLLCIVLKPEQSVTPLELYQYCRQHLPAFMLPRYIKFMDDFPRTGSQRVRKFLLAEAGLTSAWDRKKASH